MRLAVIALSCALTACAALPRSGPTIGEVEREAASTDAALPPFALVDLTPEVAEFLLRNDGAVGAAALFDESGVFGQRLAPGDVIEVTLFEPTGGGLLGGGQVGEGGAVRRLPSQTVDGSGRVRIPYAGAVQVSGLEPDSAAQRIEAALQGQAIEPQALVSIKGSPSRGVTVIGDAVEGGGRVQLTGTGDRLLDAIAVAGGFSKPLHETVVRLTRRGEMLEIPAEALLRIPDRNVALRAGDVVAIEHRQNSFVILGAVGEPSQVPFRKTNLNLAEALAQGRGLLDERADPSGVFLVRFEDPALLDDLSAITPLDLDRLPEETSPVVYRLNLTRATGLIAARRTPMEDGDILFVANAEITPAEKVLSLVGLALPGVNTGLLTIGLFRN